MNIGSIVTAVSQFTVKYAPQILTGIGLAGFTASIVFAAEAAPKAHELIIEERTKKAKELADKEKKEITTVDLPKLTISETFKCTWKLYIPTVSMAIVSAACIVGGQYIYHKRLVAMTVAYTTVAEAANKYQDKVKELVGKTKEDKINNEIAQDKVNDIPDKEFENAVSVDGGTDLFVDDLSGRVFKSTLENIKKAINEFNYQLLTEMWCDVNDYYNWIGLDKNILGSVVGWNIDKGMVEFRYDTVMRNDHPVCVIRPVNYPEARRLA